MSDKNDQGTADTPQMASDIRQLDRMCKREEVSLEELFRKPAGQTPPAEEAARDKTPPAA